MVYEDPDIPASTRCAPRYLNWYFSTEGAHYRSEIALTANGT